ncbi:MAG: phosphoglucomutase/phosphomannomutase family protein, partial [Oscillospiraceae bacterium]
MVKFGTGGWRAIIGDDFTKHNLLLLGTAVAHKIHSEKAEDKGIVIGYDRRFLSSQSAIWMAELMAGENIKCKIITFEAPTPLIMYAVKYYDCSYGMAITASHNPAIYNGVKLFTKGGRDADEVVTGELEVIIEKVTNEDKPYNIVPYEEGLKSGMIEIVNPQNAYLDSIIGSVDMEAISKRSLRVCLDPMYGVSKTSLQIVLLTARCDVEVIHDRHDTLFGGRLPAPTAKTLFALQNYVVEHHMDVGIATDGDADRLGIIDDKGNFVHPNQILVILYYYLMKYKNWRGAVVRNNSTTHMLDKVAKAFGQECIEVPVGFKYISAGMDKYDAIIGGESSGGLTVKGHISGKDGIYAATLLIEMLAITGRKLSEIYKDITDEFGDLMVSECDFRFSMEKKAEILKIIMEDKSLPTFPYEIEKVSYRDGCKVYFKNGGWVICRFSGTEALLRICCEMTTQEDADKVCDIIKDFI